MSGSSELGDRCHTERRGCMRMAERCLCMIRLKEHPSCCSRSRCWACYEILRPARRSTCHRGHQRRRLSCHLAVLQRSFRAAFHRLAMSRRGLQRRRRHRHYQSFHQSFHVAFRLPGMNRRAGQRDFRHRHRRRQSFHQSFRAAFRLLETNRQAGQRGFQRRRRRRHYHRGRHFACCRP